MSQGACGERSRSGPLTLSALGEKRTTGCPAVVRARRATTRLPGEHQPTEVWGLWCKYSEGVGPKKGGGSRRGDEAGTRSTRTEAKQANPDRAGRL